MKNNILTAGFAILLIAGIGIGINYSSKQTKSPLGANIQEAIKTGVHNMDSMAGMDGMAKHESIQNEQSPLRNPENSVTPLNPTIKDGVKEFQLTAEPIRWEYSKGKNISAWGYNGQIPGPEIRVVEGDKVKIIFTNNLPKATTIHWHGIDVPFEQDGVPGVTQKAVLPGETFVYEFIANPAGTHMYHTHGSEAMADEAEQLDMGLAGSFIIEPRNYVNKPDKEYTVILDEWNTAKMDRVSGDMSAMNMDYDTFTINGRSFPDTTPLKVKKGERVRIRVINAGTSTIHPMHLHGHQFKIVATDGNPVPESAQLTRNTLPIHPGETYDIEFIANNPGTWLFHCHELHHADGGMIVPVVYE